MIVKATHRIDEKYVIGDDKGVYRLPLTTKKKHFYKLKKLTKLGDSYMLYGKKVKIKDILFTKIEEPFILIDTDNSIID